MARNFLKESRERLGITEQQQRDRAYAAKVALETKRCREKHPGKDCVAEVVGAGPMYSCMFGGRPMD